MKFQKKHGMKGTPEYNCWIAMKQRCFYNGNHQSRKRYQELGVRICDRWANSFENFFADMGYKPSPAHSIERINNRGNYEPSNCKWATRSEQSINKERTRFIEFAGLRLCVAHWEKELGFNKGVIKARLKRGWDELKALTEPQR